MSRSVKKYPGGGFTGSSSEKDDKRIWHRRFRRITRQAIYREQEVMPHIRDVSNPWSMSKDGKQYWEKPTLKKAFDIYRFHGSWYIRPPADPIEEYKKNMLRWLQWMRK